ncbi:MAG TPA: thiamine phosphate synthase [Geminicoccaceae bacterium]|nr:thiamine phosphate synthase [Geminicoccaceae bacterium]
MTRPAFDPTLYLVTDPELGGGRPLDGLAAAAVRGGATLVQLRDKRADGRRLLDEALRLKAALDPLGVPLIVNDRADVAFAAGAAGVHVGQRDLPAAAARRLLGPDAIVGLSLDRPEDLDRADPGVVDYVAYGPVFATATKGDSGPAVGAAGIAAVRARTRLPLVAIGGLGAANLVEAVAAGADGVAVVSAIVAAPDAADASRRLRAAIDDARRRRQETRP